MQDSACNRMVVLVKYGRFESKAAQVPGRLRSGAAGRMAMAGDTRERMIEAAVHALQRDGVEGMSFTEVLRESGAARGAIYHHFPGGKSQLVAEAATDNGTEVRALLAQLPAESPAAVV